MITYSVFRLAARRTVFCGWILRLECAPVSEKRGGLNRSPVARAMGVECPRTFAGGAPGIPGGGLEPFAVPTRLSSGQHSLDLTIWPSRRNADGARGASVSAPAGGRFGFAWLERRSWVMMCPEPAGGPWGA